MIGVSQSYFQAAWVVNNLEEAMQRWIKTARVGPFFVLANVDIQHARYRGEPTTLNFSAALAQAGPIQIELIEQHDDAPSAYRDTFAVGQEGFHHLCQFVDSYDESVARHAAQGSPIAHCGQTGDMRFAYLDTRPSLGFMTEIIEDRQFARDLFKIVADAAVDWDGSDPIRTP